MPGLFSNLVRSDSFETVATVLLVIGALGLSLLIAIGAFYLLYFCVTLPLRRTERARLFIDLLELGLKEGQSPEAAILDASSSRDTALGSRFHLLAAHLRAGRRLSQALEGIPRLLPPQLIATLRAGERLGDIGKVLPACRLQLRDSSSQVRGALNYVVLLAFVMTPVSIVIPVFLRIKVLPSFNNVLNGMFEENSVPAFTRFVLDANTPFMLMQLGLFAFLCLLTLAYLGGPRLRLWVRGFFPETWDRLLWSLPWRRKRLQRDFSAMLAVLLDAEIPEPEAVRLAAEATANEVTRQRAEIVTARLNAGTKISQAVQAMDESTELRWRLANALQRGNDFARALTGWHEALDAKAFQLEQTAAQLATTLLVLLNGLVVGCIVIGIFLALVELTNNAALW